MQTGEKRSAEQGQVYINQEETPEEIINGHRSHLNIILIIKITLYAVPLAGLVLSICHSNIVQAGSIQQAHTNVKHKVVLIFTTYVNVIT